MSPIWPSLIRLNSSLAGLAVAAHQADADLEVLLRRLLAQREHLPGGRAVDGDRLLHEDVAGPSRSRSANWTQRKAGGVARITTSPGLRQSIAFL